MTTYTEKYPNPLLEIICSNPYGVDIGFEDGTWRHRQLAQHLIEWLPEFALSHSERKSIEDYNAIRLVRKAAHQIYTSEKYKRRGEFGEIILHAILRQEFNTLPAISKVFFKDSSNDTVKGFDAVHVVNTKDEELELWLGEVKFYKSISRAINDVIQELKIHSETNYLRSEFIAIENKIDSQWPLAQSLKKLMDNSTTMDETITRLCFPVLLTYNSQKFKGHASACEELTRELKAEIQKHSITFTNKLNELNKPLKILLILFPLNTKESLVSAMDQELKKLQV